MKNLKTFENWREVEEEPWDMNIMDQLLGKYEDEYNLDDMDWENIMDIKRALWIGYTFNK